MTIVIIRMAKKDIILFSRVYIHMTAGEEFYLSEMIEYMKTKIIL